jgi:hypothetical protein
MSTTTEAAVPAQANAVQRAAGPFDGSLAQRLVYWADFCSSSRMRADVLAAAQALNADTESKPKGGA